MGVLEGVTSSNADGLALGDSDAVSASAVLGEALSEAEANGDGDGEVEEDDGAKYGGVDVTSLADVPLGVPDAVLEGDSRGVADGLALGDSDAVSASAVLGEALSEAEANGDGEVEEDDGAKYGGVDVTSLADVPLGVPDADVVCSSGESDEDPSR